MHPFDTSKPVTEIIRQRFSCRTYLEKPIATQALENLAGYAAALHSGPLGGSARFGLVAGSQENLKELKGLGTYGFIKGATGFIVGATAQDGQHLEDFGYLLEHIILYATDLGLGTCWLGGTFTKTSFGKKIAVRPGELVPCVAAVGYIAPKPRRIDALIRSGAKGDRRLPWECLFFNQSFGSPLTRQAAGDYTLPLEMVRLGPSASNKQPWRVIQDGRKWHFYLQRTPGYREQRLVRLVTVADLQRVDMGIAMCHFELSARGIGLQGRWKAEEPAIQKPEAGCEYTTSWIA
ncbi:MAG: nitroreductase family protein [Chloroflexota bacterium]